MFANRLHILLPLALAAAVGVSAQNLDSCELGCINQGLANSTCSSFTDISCVCSSTSFQTTAAACLQANCSASDQEAALQLRNQECGTSSSAASGTGTAAGTSASPTSSRSSAAPLLTEQFPILPAVIAVAGVALGGAFAL